MGIALCTEHKFGCRGFCICNWKQYKQKVSAVILRQILLEIYLLFVVSVLREMVTLPAMTNLVTQMIHLIMRAVENTLEEIVTLAVALGAMQAALGATQAAQVVVPTALPVRPVVGQAQLKHLRLPITTAFTRKELWGLFLLFVS